MTLPCPAPAAPAVETDACLQLSRHALVRRIGDAVVVEHAAAGWRVPLPAGAVRALLAFARPTWMADLCSADDAPRLARLVHAWRGAGLLVAAQDTCDADDAGTASTWELHELLFHVRSRRGRSPDPAGARSVVAPVREHDRGLVAHRAPGPDAVLLPAPPDAASSGADAAGLWRALDARRTRYEVGPVPLLTLGTLLYRSARLTEVVETADGPLFRRPYPSGGGLHALELYVIARDCPGLAPGVYRYAAGAHALDPVRPLDAHGVALLADARHATGERLPGDPAVLLGVTLRYGRVARKYRAISYRLALLETGALLQTLYVAAGALDLAACALGTGDSDRWALALGTDYFAEPCIGEIVLGSAAAPAGPHP